MQIGATSTVPFTPRAPLARGDAAGAPTQADAPPGQQPGGPNDLTPEEQQVVEKLKRRDAEVRAHEQAHASAGGQYAGSPKYDFQRGPDGRNYAIGGEVAIDVSPIEGNPEATIRKMDVVKRAALAPAQPSAQDRSVAQQAEQQRLEAQQELREQRAAEQNGDANDGTEAAGPAGGADGGQPGDASGDRDRGGPPGANRGLAQADLPGLTASDVGAQSLNTQSAAAFARGTRAYDTAARITSPSPLSNLALVA